jgi:hypothetical protein
MSGHVNGGDVIGVFADAQTLPASITLVKSNPKPVEIFEEIPVLEMSLNRGREKLVVSKLSAPWGGRFVGVRFFGAQQDGTFLPTRRGLNIRIDHVELIAAAMVKAVSE